jgi:hypothetical protein
VWAVWADHPLCCASFHGVRCLVATGLHLYGGDLFMLWARPSEVLFYSLSSAGPHAAHQREGAPPAALDVTAGDATDNRAASRVALEDMEVARGGLGFQYVGDILPLEFFSMGNTCLDTLRTAHLVCLWIPW